MSLLIESIKLFDGEFYNLFYHEQRMIRSLHMLCGVTDSFNLEEFLEKMNKPTKGLFKCRIIYDDVSREVEFIPYSPREINTLQVVEHNGINYDHKYRDRTEIDELFARRKNCDDVLIVKDGMVTDTSYCNIVFKKEKTWYTPWNALLSGTMRQFLIDEDVISPVVIKKEDIRSFECFKLINAMIGFEAPEIDVSKIFL